jgi:putative transposase
MGNAVPMHIGRHTHPQAKTEAPAPPPVTGIDYLGLVLARQHEELERRTSYAGLRNANTALDNDTEEAR